MNMLTQAWHNTLLFLQTKPFDSLTILGFALMLAGAAVIARAVLTDGRIAPDRTAAKRSFGALLTKGILYEEEFISVYMKIIRDEGFMAFFGEDQPEATRLLNQLISDSEDHKASLQSILARL